LAGLQLQQYLTLNFGCCFSPGLCGRVSETDLENNLHFASAICMALAFTIWSTVHGRQATVLYGL
jgi:hypothetical protein